MQALGRGLLLYLANWIFSWFFLIQIKYTLSTGNFRVPQTLTFQARLSANLLCDYKFHLYGSKKKVRFSSQSFHLETGGATQRLPVNIMHLYRFFFRICCYTPFHSVIFFLFFYFAKQYYVGRLLMRMYKREWTFILGMYLVIQRPEEPACDLRASLMHTPVGPVSRILPFA